MNVVAAVAEVSDFLGKQFYSLRRVAENDALIDLEFGEEGVEAVDLLFLLDEGIILSDTLQCQLVHQVHFVRLPHVLFLQSKN